MIKLELKNNLKNINYYIIGLVIIFCLTNFNMIILSPTAHWVSILTGLKFIKELNIGYVNHEHRFIIATSCAGINFMIIVFATIYFTFVSQFDNRIKWLGFSFVFSYFYTIFINGIRIALSIYAPMYIKFISNKTLHTALGTVIFFLALLLAYKIINNYFIKAPYKNFIPIVYYMIITIFVPLLIRFYNRNFNGFFNHCLIIISVCFVCVFVLKKR